MAGCLGFKEMLCVQSKQKAVEYQQSFIKQLMDLESLEEPILGWENLTQHTQTHGDVPPSAFSTCPHWKGVAQSCEGCRQLVMDKGERELWCERPRQFRQGLGGHRPFCSCEGAGE